MAEDTRSTTHIGAKIVALREAHGVSRDELAQRAGMSTEELAAIEGSTTVNGLAPLVRITSALGMNLGTLLDDDKGMGPAVTRRAELEDASTRASLETGTADAPLDFFSLAKGKTARHMNPFMIDISPETKEDMTSHEGEEFIYVMSGKVEIAYGKDVYLLEPGDSIYYDSMVPHQVRDGQSGPSRILACVYTPA